MSARNYTIDLVRLIASFFVLALHVDLGVSDLTNLALIKLACRWAVPFFFLVSGYFYQIRFAKDPVAAFKKNTLRLLKIYVVTSIVYWPLAYSETGVLFKLGYLHSGTYGPLWFLPSMILGFVVLYGLHQLRLSDKQLLFVSCIVFAFVLLKDSYANLIPGFSTLPHHHKRIFISIPCLFLGMYIKKREDRLLHHLNWQVGALLVITGYALQVLEAYTLLDIKGYPLVEHQFLLGTLLMASGVFVVSLTIRSQASLFSNWGESYSLMIYLYHPLIIACLTGLQLITGVSFIWPFTMAGLVFLTTLLFVSFIHVFIPNVFSFLSGTFQLPFEKPNWIRSWRT